MPLSDHERNLLLDQSVSGTTYLALCEQHPKVGDTGDTLVEATYDGYVRIPLAENVWTAAAEGVKKSTVTLSFPACLGGESLVIAWAICTADFGGEVRWFGPKAAQIVNTSDPTPTIQAGELILELS